MPVGLRLSADEAQRIASLAKALSQPVRVQIVELLSRHGGDVCVCDIERHFDLSQPTISHHLKVLREAGIIRGEARGVWVYYRLVAQALAPLAGLLADLG
ncbi:MAG: ArsR/SmtB family transcription factor [Aggregatilineaceae bacterium]